MRSLFCFLFVAGIMPLCAQNQDSPSPLSVDQTTKKYTTSGIIYIDSVPAKTLLEGTYIWLSDVKYVASIGSKGIDMDEAIFNRIRVSQYFIGSKAAYSTKVRFIINLAFKDGKLKYTFTDFVFLKTTAKTEFEEVKNSTDMILLKQIIYESNNYINQWVRELTVFLKSYKPNDNW